MAKQQHASFQAWPLSPPCSLGAEDHEPPQDGTAFSLLILETPFAIALTGQLSRSKQRRCGNEGYYCGVLWLPLWPEPCC
jgi:hypothetical protein